MTTPSPHIGTLNEKPLHAALKAWYSEEGDRFEVPMDGFVIDIVREQELIEIHTGPTSALKRKLTALIAKHPLRLVLPVAARKTIVRLDADGDTIYTRQSPKREGVLHAFLRLVSLPDLLGDSNLSIDIVLTTQQELRRPRTTRRRKDWIVEERRLVEVVDCVSLHHPADFLAVIPSDLEEPFTTADLARALSHPRKVAQQIAYVLRRMHVLCVVGKQGNSILYRRNRSGQPPDDSERR